MNKDIDDDQFSGFLNTVKTQFAAAEPEPVKIGIQLDRTTTKKLLRTLERLDSKVPGCAIMQAQLRGVLERRDWLLINIAGDTTSLPKVGVGIGIAQAKISKIKSPRRSPLQKWQQRKGLGKRTPATPPMCSRERSGSLSQLFQNDEPSQT